MTVTTTEEPRRRISGATPAEESAAEAAETLEDPEDVKEPSFDFSVSGFGSRMRTEWEKGDLARIEQVEGKVNSILNEEFWDLYAILYFFYEKVREPLTRPGGEIARDEHGRTRWKRYPAGHPMEGLVIEDWGELTRTDMRDFLLKLNANLINWRARAEKMRSAALYAKSNYEGTFAEAFETLPQDPKRARLPTERDREQRARRISEEDRLFALYQTSLSRQADTLVRGIERMEQRLIDLLKLPA